MSNNSIKEFNNNSSKIRNESMNEQQNKQMTQDIDYTFKVVLVGDSGVGKSTLLKRLIEGDSMDTIIFENRICSQGTIGVDFKYKTFILDHNNIKICLNFFDTSGNQKFRQITKSYFLNVQAFIIMYDVNDMQSFLNCQQWLDEINKTYFSSAPDKTNQNKLIKILVGCKDDNSSSSINSDQSNQNQSQQKVSSKKAKDFAKKNGFILFYETSSKDNLKIKELFDELCLELIANYLNFLNYQRTLIDLAALPDEFKKFMLNKSKNTMPLPALTSKENVYFDCQSESLNCNHIILNNTNSKRKNLQTKGLVLSDLFDFF
jgi:small GTP-binding protein